MKEFQEYQRQLTYKGAVVIPIEIRQLLGARLRARVTFRVVNEKRTARGKPTLVLSNSKKLDEGKLL
jgi:bifunctional DNA-binding transcriptional regulator/antitoxin component of YhaV-PrlF toxin-antitoxin module